MAEHKSKPKVSVVLPVFNAANTLKRAVDSMLCQKYDHWQLVIVNDGSTDGTLKYLRDLDDQRIAIYTLPHCGIGRALNFGIRMSSGEYIARMDADDVSSCHRLSSQAYYLDQNPSVGLVSGQVTYMGDRTTQAGYAHYVDTINAIVKEEDIVHKRFFESPFAHPSVMFRKSLIAQYGGYNEQSLPEDYELWLRWLSNGVRMHKLDQEVLCWYDSKQRLSRTNLNYAPGKFFDVKAHYFHFWLAGNSDRIKQIWVFGSGKEVNRRLRPFIKRGITIERFIDVKKRYNVSKYIHFNDLPEADANGSRLILSFVRDRAGREAILTLLQQLRYKEGVDFFIMA
ncbi:glycosyltransferase [Fulvivirga sp. M361]|uniref:glycosyltransferase n=1 Tax=Fulvivirga sp. M361 TaxID=2594266 RepID=UPI0016249273|nr:glycosyltransferase [Fulvivirga sp. M361]